MVVASLLNCTRQSSSARRVCSYTTLRRSSAPRERDDTGPIFQYVGKHKKANHKVFVWGFSFTGALGIPSFVVPDSGRKTPRKYQLTPYRLDTAEQVRSFKKTPSGSAYSAIFGVVCVRGRFLLLPVAMGSRCSPPAPKMWSNCGEWVSTKTLSWASSGRSTAAVRKFSIRSTAYRERDNGGPAAANTWKCLPLCWCLMW